MKSALRSFISAIPLCLFLLSSTSSRAQGTWEAKAPMPQAQGGSVGVLCNGSLHVFSGSPAVNEAYDPITDIWSFGTPDPLNRGAMSMALIGGKVFSAGGWVNFDSNSPTNALMIYDPAIQSWTSAAPMAQSRGFMASGMINDKLYVTGGTV